MFEIYFDMNGYCIVLEMGYLKRQMSEMPSFSYYL